jgi:cell division transport system permease protein
MSIWLSQHFRTIGATLGKLARAPLANLLNAIVIGVALAFPAAFHVLLSNLQTLTQQVLSAPQLSVFIARNADAADAARIKARLDQHPQVHKYRYIPRSEALKELRASTGLADVIDSLERNPLPDTFVVDATETGAKPLDALRDEIAGWPGVEQVQLDSRWAQRLEALLYLGRLVVLLLGALLAFALIAVTFNTIRLQVLTQRDEIEVSRLFGATHAFIRRPFLYFGTFTGLAGGLAAWGIVLVGVYLFNDGLAELSRVYGIAIRLEPIAMRDGASLLGFAAGLGWLGAWLSVNRHLAAFAPS